MRILNFGSLNIDNTYRVKTIVKPGETIAATETDYNCGGKGLNQSVALSRAGMEVIHAGAVGSDGQILIEMLKDAGVITEKIKKIPGKSGHTIIQIDDVGQNSIILYGGANRKISEEYIDEVFVHVEPDDLLLLQNEINNLSYILEKAKERKMQVILNPSPMEDYIKKLDLSSVVLFFVNEIEGSQMTGGETTEEILQIFSEKYPSAAVVLTLGTRGAVYQFGKKRYFQEAYKVEAVDTTAAGDTFTGYFIKEYFETNDPERALRMATKASSIAVTRSGAAQSIPCFDEIII